LAYIGILTKINRTLYSPCHKKQSSLSFNIITVNQIRIIVYLWWKHGFEK